MNDITGVTWWAGVVILVVPLLIIVAAEFDERLRQRESTLRPAVTVIREWGLPFFAVWAVLVPVLGVDNDNLAVRIAASGMIFAVAAAVLRVIQALVTAYRNRPRLPGTRAVPQLLLALPRIVTIIVAGWLLIDSVWGVDLSAALTALGVTSLVISFALQDTLSGLASGMLLLSDQPFKPGDWITTGDTEGEVIDLSWRTTRIRTRDGDVIIVPNSELAGSAVVNYSSPDPLHRVGVSLQVAYVNPPTLAIEMLLDAARSTPGVLAEPPPHVFVTQIDDPLMGYDVHMWVRDYAIVPKVKSDFGRLVWYQSHRHNVPLPSPAQDLYLYDGVAAGEVGIPTTEDLRNGLQRSPLLSSLSDDELDTLASSTIAARFAVGEVILGPGTTERNLYIIDQGLAQLSVPIDGQDAQVGEFGAGEALGVLDLTSSAARGASINAVTDCEVFVIDSQAIGNVGSRNVEVSTAMNRLASIRRRRLDRVLEREASRLDIPALDLTDAVVDDPSPEADGGSVAADAETPTTLDSTESTVDDTGTPRDDGPRS